MLRTGHMAQGKDTYSTTKAANSIYFTTIAKQVYTTYIARWDQCLH